MRCRSDGKCALLKALAVDDPVGIPGTRLTCHVLLVTVARTAHDEIEESVSLWSEREGLIAQPVALYRGIKAPASTRQH